MLSFEKMIHSSCKREPGTTNSTRFVKRSKHIIEHMTELRDGLVAAVSYHFGLFGYKFGNF